MWRYKEHWDVVERFLAKKLSQEGKSGRDMVVVHGGCMNAHICLKGKPYT